MFKTFSRELFPFCMMLSFQFMYCISIKLCKYNCFQIMVSFDMHYHAVTFRIFQEIHYFETAKHYISHQQYFDLLLDGISLPISNEPLCNVYKTKTLNMENEKVQTTI